MRRATGVKLPDDRYLYVYGEHDRQRAHREIFRSERGKFRLWSVTFYGEEGDDSGRRHIGELNAWVQLHLYPTCAIIELDCDRVDLASRGSGEYPNAGQYVSHGRIYPGDSRIPREQAESFVNAFLTEVDVPDCVEWQVPSGTVARGPFGVTLP